MDAGNLQTVLRCNICNKPFDKQSTLKRHGYYCRSRRLGTVTRSRSCNSCVKAKTRCDNSQPECSRCITKGLKCQYPEIRDGNTELSSKKKRNTARTSELPTSSPAQGANSQDVKYRDDLDNEDVLIPDPVSQLSMSQLSEPETGDLDTDLFDWSIQPFDLPGTLTPQMNSKVAPFISMESTTFDGQPTSPSNRINQTLFFPNASIPLSPTDNARSLVERPRIKTGRGGIAKLIFHTLKSYSLMIMQHNTLPPFINPSFLASHVSNGQMEPVNNCISLVRMISSDVQGSRKLFWRSVRLECERLCEEYLELDKWGLLAAMQALFIYLLIRIGEGETDHNNFDSLLIRTVTLLAKRLAYVEMAYMTQAALSDYSLEVSWKDWIYDESRRRLCVVAQVVNMMVYFEPSAMCNRPRDIVLAPLPAMKQLWEASDEYSWELETRKEPGILTAFGLAASGDLIRVDDILPNFHSITPYKASVCPNPSQVATNWEEWCAGMDSMGGLVMLAASLIA